MGWRVRSGGLYVAVRRSRIAGGESLGDGDWKPVGYRCRLLNEFEYSLSRTDWDSKFQHGLRCMSGLHVVRNFSYPLSPALTRQLQSRKLGRKDQRSDLPEPLLSKPVFSIRYIAVWLFGYNHSKPPLALRPGVVSAPEGTT